MNIAIRKFEERDIVNKINWINDERNNRYLHYDLPLKYENTCHWFKRNQKRTDRYDAVIEVDGIPVGVIGLLSIDRNNSKAEYYITMGSHEYKGRGIATEASRLILKYAFDQLGLNKVYLFTEVENTTAQRLFEKVGFKREGVLRSDIKSRGQFVDRFVYGVFKKDYYKHMASSEEDAPKAQKKGFYKPTEIVKSVLQIQDNIIYIKRDDLLPLSFGGNKARKAILFFEDIEKENCDCVVTYGSSSSNHCRIIANMAAAKGILCYIISPLEASKPTTNSKMVEFFGAIVTKCPVVEVSATIEAKLADLKGRGYNPYFIQGGGHGNIGTQAYVDCYEEIVEYEKTTGVHFDYIFHASGTGTTQAGLICGKIIHGDDKQIIGISNARRNPRGGQVVVDSVNRYLDSIDRMGVDNNVKSVAPEHTIFIDDYVLDGYGTYNNDILQTIKEVLICDGIPMDTTYTGKAFWGMKNYIIKNQITGKNILFIHTGGTPLFFDDLEELDNE
jgi:D-cysteine desulfhydrase